MFSQVLVGKVVSDVQSLWTLLDTLDMLLAFTSFVAYMPGRCMFNRLTPT